MSRRSWTTLKNTESAQRLIAAKLDGNEPKTHVGNMVGRQSYALDAADARDRALTAAAAVEHRRFDYGDDD